MGWAQIAELIIEMGLPAVQALVAKWEANGNVTSAQLTELAVLANRDARNRMLNALQAQGIDPASPQGLALLAAIL